MSARVYGKGLAGEALAEQYLTERGMTCEARRYRGADGEIDLVMRDGETLVFVEVKYRPNAPKGSGLLSVTPSKRRRMIHAASFYATERDAWSLPIRFDVVEVTRDGVLHIPNAFMAEG